MRRGSWIALVAAAGLAIPVGGGGPAVASMADVPDATPAYAGDAASASALAGELGRPVQVTDLTTEISDTLAMPDGSFESRFFAEPVRVRNGSSWVDVDTTLRMNADGSVSPTGSLSDLTFSGGGSGPAVRLAKDGHVLELTWSGGLPKPSIDGDTATYTDVLPSVDLRLRAGADGFAQVLVVKDRSAAEHPALRSIRWGVETTGLTVRDDGDGRFALVDDATAEPVWFAPESYMWDSSSPAAADVAKGRVGAEDASLGLATARVDVAAASTSLTVAPDPAMLSDPDLTFPLYIDPELIGYSTGWTHVNSGARDTSYWTSYRDSMRVGLQYGTTCCVWRSIVRFNLGAITNQGQQVLAAQFRTLLDHSASCSPTSVDLWWTDWLDKGRAYTWNNTNSFGPSGFWNEYLVTVAANANEAGGCGTIQPDAWMHFGGGGGRLRDIVQGSVSGTCGCIAFGLKASVENDQSKWKRFYPADSATVGQRTYLWIRHDRPPAVPSVQSFSSSDCDSACTSPAVVRTTTPTLRVGVSDPDQNSTLRSLFEVRTAPSDTATVAATNSGAPVITGSPGSAAWSVPAGKLVGATTYYWRAATQDELGVWGPWTTWQTMSVDVAPPTILAPTSAEYPERKWGAEVGTPGSFRFTGSSDVTAFTWWVDGGSSTTVPATGTTSKIATVTYTPATDMVHTLHVRARDAAGNTGPTVDYEFWVSPVPARCWYWKFDETSGATANDSGKADCTPADATVTAVPGTLSGSYAWTLGHDGNSVTLSGGVVTMDQPVLDGNKSFTVAAWVKPTNLAAGDQTVISLDGANTSRFQLSYDAGANLGAGGWCFSMRSSDSTSVAPVSACATGAVPDDLGLTHPPTDDTWVHLAGVYNAATGQLQIHVMGNPIACFGEMVQTPFSGSWTSFGSLVMGRAKSGGADSELFRGNLDEVRAYPIALTTQKICQIAGL